MAAFLLTGARRAAFELSAIWLNGSPAARVEIDGTLDTAVSLTIEHGRITRIYAIRNPHKLAGLDSVATLSRSKSS